MSTLSSPTSSSSSGPSVTVSRVLYIILAVLCLAVFALSLNTAYTIGTADCDSAYHSEWEGCAEWDAALTELGMSTASFQTYFLVLRLLAAAPLIALSLYLFLKHGQEGHILFFAGFLLVLAVAGTWFNPLWGWANYWLEDFSAWPFLAPVTYLLSFLLFSGLVWFALLFPDGRFQPTWTRWPAYLWLLLASGFAFFPDSVLSFENWPYPQFTALPLALFYIALTAGAMISRVRRQETAVARQQVGWVAAGFLLMAANYLLDYSVWGVYPLLTDSYLITTGRASVRWELIQDSLWYGSLIFFAACFYVAIFRTGLWGEDGGAGAASTAPVPPRQSASGL